MGCLLQIVTDVQPKIFRHVCVVMHRVVISGDNAKLQTKNGNNKTFQAFIWY